MASNVGSYTLSVEANSASFRDLAIEFLAANNNQIASPIDTGVHGPEVQARLYCKRG